MPFNKLHYKENVFQLKSLKKYVVLFIIARKIPLTILVTVGHSFEFVPHMFTWTGSSYCKRILGLTEIILFGVNASIN